MTYKDRVIEKATEEARAEVLRDVDSFQDWLSGVCMNTAAKSVGFVSASVDISDWPIDALVSVMLSSENARDSRLEALDLIAERYLADSQKLIDAAVERRIGGIAEEDGLRGEE